MKVRDIMSTEVTTASPDSTLQELASMMRDEDVGSIPIVEDGDLTGIITDRDIVLRCIADGKDPGEVTAEEIVSERLETIAPDDGIEKASRIMGERQIRRLPVVENGRLVGMLAIGDIAVKQGDERVSGETLEDISAGVKASARKPRGGAQPSARRTKGAQGIANQQAGREQKPPSRVVPFRKKASVPERASTRRAGVKARRRRVS
jgi:CBS domain-containing protein